MSFFDWIAEAISRDMNILVPEDSQEYDEELGCWRDKLDSDDDSDGDEDEDDD